MKRSLAMLTLTSALVVASGAFAQTMDKNVKIGVLNDQSSLYADITGAGSALAAADGGRGFRTCRPRAGRST